MKGFDSSLSKVRSVSPKVKDMMQLKMGRNWRPRCFAFILLCLFCMEVVFWIRGYSVTLRAKYYWFHPPFCLSSYKKLLEEMNVQDLQKIDFPLKSETFIKDLHISVISNFTMVTAVSSNHFNESLDNIASVQLYLPKHRIIVYDLGLKLAEKQELAELCYVEVRSFPFEIYPPHVRNLNNYAWKVLIIHEVLRSHPAVFWMDASIRFGALSLSSAVNSVINSPSKYNGVFLFKETLISNFAVTHPGMYKYLDTYRELHMDVNQYAATAMLLYRTHAAVTDVLFWFVLCAMQKECIDPTGALKDCSFDERIRNVYGNCHRYDQSAINVILRNLYGYDTEKFTLPYDIETFVILRDQHGRFKPKIC